MSEKLTLAQFENLLDQTCDSLRGDRDFDEFKEYVIAILFLKRLNDRFNLERKVRRDKLVLKGFTEQQIEEDLEKREVYRMFVPEIARWNKLREQKEDLGDYLMKTFAEIDRMNRGCMGVLNTVDFNKTMENGRKFLSDEDLVQLIKKFEQVILSDDYLAF